MNLFDDFDTTQLALRRPPANDSLQTFKELQELNNTNVDPNIVEEKDDIVGSFEKINVQNNIPFPKEEVTKIQNDSTSVIKSLKKHFNRPRPKEIANQISDSRNIGRAHFKSDSTFGKEVGDKLYEHLKEKNYAI
jgi:hypothetical protein